MNFGELLTSKRTSKKLELSKVATDLKIKSKYLEAFEKENFEDMPLEPYASGFLKSYASYLGLDVEDILEKYRDKKRYLFVPNEVAEQNIVEKEIKEIDLKDKIKTFQSCSFFLGQKKCDLDFISRIINISFWSLIAIVAVGLIFSFSYVFHKRNISKINISKFEKLSDYSMEISTNGDVWMNVKTDGVSRVFGIVKTDIKMNMSFKDNVSFKIGDIRRVQVVINGKRIDVKKHARKNVNTILINKDTFNDWIVR